MNPERTLVRAVTHKKPVPEMDFTLHSMEDGSQVSTLERVIKGNDFFFFLLDLFCEYILTDIFY